MRVTRIRPGISVSLICHRGKRFMNFVTPTDFPQEAFQEFGKCASAFFPEPLSDEAASDPLQRQHQFMRSWVAVRFRYRACCEANEEFKSLFANATELWREW